MDDGRQRLATMLLTGQRASVAKDKPRELTKAGHIEQQVLGAASFYEHALFKQISVVQKAKSDLKGALGVDLDGTVSAAKIWSRVAELVEKRDKADENELRDAECFKLALKKFERMLDSGFQAMDEEIKGKSHRTLIRNFIKIYGDAELKRAAGVTALEV